MASEEYASRMASPRPASAAKRRSVQYAESPLRKTSFPASETTRVNLTNDEPVEDNEEVIHIDPPTHHPPIEGGSPNPLEPGEATDQGYQAPILAADEVAHRPEAQFLTPAVDPDHERRANFFGDITPGYVSNSRPNSRSNSVQIQPPNLGRLTGPTDRDASNTPLEDVQEYEPLFPDDDEKEKKSQSQKEESKDADSVIPRHHFPSKDVWEDVPNSMLYETTVKTPQLPDDCRPEAEHEPKEIFERPEAEAAGKSQQASEQANLRPDPAMTKMKSFNRDVLSEMPSRPGMGQRFPSRDIWEDTPSSLLYTTTITPDPKEDALAAKVPQIPARPARGAKEDTSPIDRKGPQIPGRPKPQVPARPARTSSGDSLEGVALARSSSKEDDTTPGVAATKAKPPVPARPAGGKIAALKAGFMSDLNSRLQLGPQAVPKPQEKEVEEEKEKAPLVDARKGRAKGPARRKPGVSPAASAASEEAPKLTFASVRSIWEMDDCGHVTAGSGAAKSADMQTATSPEEPGHHAPVTKIETAPISGRADKTSQTGQQDIEVQNAPGESIEKHTIYLGGRASEPGTIVLKDGEEHVGSSDGLGGIEKMVHAKPFTSERN
jgi:Altered inheritance of mitochondria protein 21